MTLIIEEVKKSHRRADFDCGHEGVNNYIRKTALQHNKSEVSGAISYCLVDKRAPTVVLGYYSLHSTEQTLNHVLQKTPKKSPVGCLLLGWLGVDKKVQKSGLATILLHDAFKKFVSYGGIFAALLVDPLMDKPKVVKFYEDNGFKPCSDTQYFITQKTIKAALSSKDEQDN